MTPTEIYRSRPAERVAPDAAQLDLLARLDDLVARLTVAQPKGLRRVLGAKPAAVRGLYIHGDVGRGKTMLMDLFFDSVKSVTKERVHFHAFMQGVHRRRAALRGDDVIASIADDIAGRARLLCLDEMQIVDIADAMIIGRLFEALVARGVCVVTTSNLPPEGLYKDGLNRDLFLPFIARLREKLDVVALDGGRDYRLGRIATRETFIVPPDAVKLEAIWNDLTDGAAGEPRDLDVLGRKLHVPRQAHGCAWFGFSQLCEQPLGPPDYLALATAFKTVFISDIPLMSGLERNAVKRFVLMIDTFYDAHVRLVATAAAAPEKLREGGHHGSEFKRTVSRLQEMRSGTWWR